MPLTPEEIRVGKRADALLLQVESGGVFTLEDLARFLLEVGHTDVSFRSSSYDSYESRQVHTTDMLRVHLLSLPNDGRWAVDRTIENPQLTIGGVVQLLHMGNHAIAVAIRNYNGDHFRGALDKLLGAVEHTGK